MSVNYKFTCVLAIAVFSSAQAATINVPGDQPTIQAAINVAMTGDQVVVAPGTYQEAINLLGKAITVCSSGGPAVTTIDGTGNHHVVQCVSGEGPDTILDGFTITGGNADGDDFLETCGGGMLNISSSPTVTNCMFSENLATLEGGGMFNLESNPMVANCTFNANTAFSAGGGGMLNDSSSPMVTDCTFSDNGTVISGGGMLNKNGSSPTVTNCLFSGNSANDGGGMRNQGGSDPRVTNCMFIDNYGDVDGGGMSISNSNPTVVNCTFRANLANIEGGGIDLFNSSTTVINCTFIGNSGGFEGGGMNIAGDPTVVNCTFVGNWVEFDGGGMNISGSATVTNCVLWNNSPDQVSGGAAASINYSDIEGGFPGLGNIDADPMFIDPDNGDCRLSPGSPCIDAGNNWGVASDSVDLDSDDDTIELTPWDLDGNPRFTGDGNDFDPGCGEPVIVDMGAYERPGSSFNVVFGDLNGNGTVGVLDLMILNECLGSDDPDCCIADLNLDGQVGMIDLMLMGGALVEFVPATAVP